jgi:hypothetical protein
MDEMDATSILEKMTVKKFVRNISRSFHIPRHTWKDNIDLVSRKRDSTGYGRDQKASFLKGCLTFSRGKNYLTR